MQCSLSKHGLQCCVLLVDAQHYIVYLLSHYDITPPQLSVPSTGAMPLQFRQSEKNGASVSVFMTKQGISRGSECVVFGGD